MTKGFHGFSSSPASPVISRPDFNVVIDTSPFLSPESVTIPRDVTLSVTKFRKRFGFDVSIAFDVVFCEIRVLILHITYPSRTAMDSLNFTNETALKQVRDENYRLEEAVISNKIINKDEQKLAIQKRTGGWKYASILLVNQGLATLAFFGVGVNLVLFLTRVLGQDNASAANNVSKWTGTVYMCSLIGAFLSDSYWGRYLTCTIFQLIFVLGLSLLSISSGLFLVKPAGCGDGKITCMPTSSVGTAIFYLAIYLIAFGYGGHQPTIATFGSDQFDEANPKEKSSKAAFFCYFYFSLNAGSLFSNTILAYYEDSGRWTLGFLVSLGSAVLALVLFWSGTRRYRYVQAYGNPLPRIAQVFVAVARKWDVIVPANSDELYEVEGPESAIKGSRKIIHCNEFAFLDKAATITENDLAGRANPWRLCTVTQVEEAKCVLKMIPIWLCTIIYSVIFTQMASLFVEQGDVMNSNIGNFHLPAASMSAFDVCSVLICTGIYRQILVPLAGKLSGNPKGLTELQRMGIGLIIGMLAMVAAGVTEIERLRHVIPGEKVSTLSIFWQIPQYVLVGASEVFMYIGQLEFFNDQAPDGIKSFGSSLCMASMSLGNYTSSLLVNMIMKITGKGDKPGWIPEDLNTGHMDRFYFLIAVLTAFDFVFYLFCAKWYKAIVLEDSVKEVPMENKQEDVLSIV
ncbi:protein NRT1/ PTR FAMILY 7.1 [Tripterygium wilfordii]|nr:protein NRT1/ PTR FAMILY 7.1 [Tripterygium wilfordii]